MIPKKIHYSWVGGGPLNEMAEKCIASWRAVLEPAGYEIIEWNAKNFDCNQNLYCRQAFAAKKWAFVSDFMRLKILHDHGGIYLDSDVEVLKPFDEKFLELPAFSVFEHSKTSTHQIDTGSIIAAEAGNPWITYLLRYYDNDRPFLLPSGEPNYTTHPSIVTAMTKKMYPEIKLKNKYQTFEYVTIFPSEYFSPKRWWDKKLFLTKNSYSIHHYGGEWKPTKTTRPGFKSIVGKILGRHLTDFIRFKILKRPKNIPTDLPDYNPPA